MLTRWSDLMIDGMHSSGMIDNYEVLDVGLSEACIWGSTSRRIHSVSFYSHQGFESHAGMRTMATALGVLCRHSHSAIMREHESISMRIPGSYSF